MVPRTHWPVLPPTGVGGSRWALVASRDTIRTGDRTGLLRVNTLRVSVSWIVAGPVGSRRRGTGSGSELPSLISWWEAAAEDEPQNQPGPGARLPAQVPAGGRQRRREGRDSGEPAGRSIRVPVRVQHGWVSELEPGWRSVIGLRRTCQLILEVNLLFLLAAENTSGWNRARVQNRFQSELRYFYSTAFTCTGSVPPQVLSEQTTAADDKYWSDPYFSRTRDNRKSLGADHRSVNQNSDRTSSEPAGDPGDGPEVDE